jgi:hypothetical protein
MQADPLGYVDGPNQYEHVGSSPVDSVDPEGLAVVRSGADVPLKPITGNPIPMNGRGYAETYIYNPWWGRTYVDDTKWDGDRYNGDIKRSSIPSACPRVQRNAARKSRPR